jgi:NarL family two-component system response regulator LiaR
VKVIKVLIVDDHLMVREGLKSFLDLYDEIEIVGQASNGQEAIGRAQELKPDVILMDLVMPEMDGATTIAQLKNKGSSAKFIVLTSYAADQLIFQALKAGALGYLMKDVSPENLVDAIRAVNLGVPKFDPEVTKKIVKHATGEQFYDRVLIEKLTDREQEVLTYVARGLSNKEIAEQIHLSLKTVKTHVSNVIQKMGVTTRTQVAILAVREHMLN